jgi:hypothetical protein
MSWFRYVSTSVPSSLSSSVSDVVPPPSWRHRPTNWGVINGQTQDHGNILKCHPGLTTRKVEHVGLRTPPVHKCRQRNGVHHRQTTDDDPTRRMNNVYRSSHFSRPCIQILSGCSTWTSTRVIYISFIRYNILMKKKHKSNHIAILTCLSSVIARSRCLAFQDD